MGCNVLIWGGCVSRDIFNIDGGEDFRIVDYYARQSFGSLISGPYNHDLLLHKIKSNFRRRMVARDFLKTFLNDAENISSADVIIIDLIVERLNLVVLPSGHVVTHSNELRESGLLDESRFRDYQLLKSGTEERRNYWSQGMGVFFNKIKDLGKMGSVLINKVYWTSKVDPQGFSPLSISQRRIDFENQELEWMYERLAEFLPESQFLNFPSNVLVADPKHRWGVTPYHYVPSYYRIAQDMIRNKFISDTSISS